MGLGWKYLGRVRYRAPYGANYFIKYNVEHNLLKVSVPIVEDCHLPRFKTIFTPLQINTVFVNHPIITLVKIILLRINISIYSVFTLCLWIIPLSCLSRFILFWPSILTGTSWRHGKKKYTIRDWQFNIWYCWLY